MIVPDDFTAPLAQWLKGGARLPRLDFFAKAKADLEFGAFIALVKVEPLYKAGRFPAQSLQQSWDKNHAYVTRVLEIVRPDEDSRYIDLDHEDRLEVREELGPPPPPCLPLYLISVGAEASEKLMYVGKTSSATGRFSRGHHAITHLLDPRYGAEAKQIYRAQVMLTTDSGTTEEQSHIDYFPLEWVHPFELAAEYLDSMESQLIFEFQPKLNIRKKGRYTAQHPMCLQVSNCIAGSTFLDGLWLYPPADGST